MSTLGLDQVSVRIGPRSDRPSVSAELDAGQFVALIGPNGAGKTTLLRAIAGLCPAEGRIAIRDRLLGQIAIAERARLIGFLPQGHQAHWPLPAQDIVALGRYPHGGRDPSRLSPADEAIVLDAMAQADCTHLAGQTVADPLRRRERARVMVARLSPCRRRSCLPMNRRPRSIRATSSASWRQCRRRPGKARSWSP